MLGLAWDAGCWFSLKACMSDFFASLTCADVHDVVERVPPLNNVHSQSGVTDVVLHDQRICGNGLNHLAHEEESLSILKTTLR